MSESNVKPPSEGQIQELFSIAMHVVPADRVQATIEKPHAFIAHVAAYFSPQSTSAAAVDPMALLERRIECYTKAGLVWDIPLSEIPAPPPGFTSPIPVLKGMTPNQAFALCKSRFPCSRWTEDLDTAIVHSDRDPHKKSYVIWVRPRTEADEELKGLSANQIAKQGVKGITLTERLLFEWFFYDETNAHLDVQNVTLCSGSRSSGGSVPNVHWNPVSGEFDVDWNHPGNRPGSLRTRQVVSSVSL